MTNLSRQLCEVCGIKRKRKIFDQRCDNTCKYLDKTDVYDPCKRGNNPCPTYIKYVYPDFEQPENFVKLMELKVKGLSGGNLTLMGILNKEYWLSDRQDYIRFLCQYFISDLTPYWQDKLKQAIREMEWVYE